MSHAKATKYKVQLHKIAVAGSEVCEKTKCAQWSWKGVTEYETDYWDYSGQVLVF